MGGQQGGGGGPSKEQVEMQKQTLAQGYEQIALQKEALAVSQKSASLSAEAAARQREKDAAAEQQQLANAELRSRGAFLGVNDALGQTTNLDEEEMSTLGKKARIGA